MKRTATYVVLALFVGILVGAFMIAPLMNPIAMAQEKQAPTGKGKCVGVCAVNTGQATQEFLISRAFEDGTVEFLVRGNRNLASFGRWDPAR